MLERSKPASLPIGDRERSDGFGGDLGQNDSPPQDGTISAAQLGARQSGAARFEPETLKDDPDRPAVERQHMESTRTAGHPVRAAGRVSRDVESQRGSRPDMRPGQNRRMRGRNRNTKGPNPLTRSYELNGPDVKIRGTAQHIAEKYGQLARDAQASGDPVAAENYHQHAEHYYRIIAAAQEQFREQFGGATSSVPSTMTATRRASAATARCRRRRRDIAGQPQPYELRPEQGERQDRFDRGDRQDRGDRSRAGPVRPGRPAAGAASLARKTAPAAGPPAGPSRALRQRTAPGAGRPARRSRRRARAADRQDRAPGARARPERPDYRQDQPRFERPSRSRDEVADQGRTDCRLS